MGISGGEDEVNLLQQLDQELKIWQELMDEEVRRVGALRDEGNVETIPEAILLTINRVSTATSRIAFLVERTRLQDLTREESPPRLEDIVNKLTSWGFKLIQLVQKHIPGVKVQSYTLSGHLGMALGATIGITFSQP